MSAAKEDVETLMNEAFGRADEMLREHGEFPAYGAAMTPDHEVVEVEPDVGEEKLSSRAVIEYLEQAFRQTAERGEFLATAIVYDVRIPLPESSEETEAIAMQLDHRDNYSVVVCFPYTLNQGEVEYGELLAQEGTHDIYGQTP